MSGRSVGTMSLKKTLCVGDKIYATSQAGSISYQRSEGWFIGGDHGEVGELLHYGLQSRLHLWSFLCALITEQFLLNWRIST